jgi:hypothetical protein
LLVHALGLARQPDLPVEVLGLDLVRGSSMRRATGSVSLSIRLRRRTAPTSAYTPFCAPRRKKQASAVSLETTSPAGISMFVFGFINFNRMPSLEARSQPPNGGRIEEGGLRAILRRRLYQPLPSRSVSYPTQWVKFLPIGVFTRAVTVKAEASATGAIRCGGDGHGFELVQRRELSAGTEPASRDILLLDVNSGLYVNRM